MKIAIENIKRTVLNTLLKAGAVSVSFSFKLLKHTNWTGLYLSTIMREYERNYPYYMAYIIRPKNADQVVSIEESDTYTETTGIIMQGPLKQENNFTVETVKLYAKMYPGATVIISTWNNENAKIIEELKSQPNCIVVQNDYPQYSGILNVNYQAWSTLNGIKKAKELGLKYVWKTRADHRYLRKGAVRHMRLLLEEFPVDENVKYQRKRIVTAAAYLFRPYWNMDQWNFGYIDDMYDYWNHDFVQKDIKSREVTEYLKKNHVKWIDRTRKHLEAETSILLDYFRRMEGKEPELTVKEYWRRLSAQFIVVGKGEFFQQWIKDEFGSKYDETMMSGIYIADDTTEKCNSYIWDFGMWLALYKRELVYKEEYEKFKENRY